MCDYRLNFLNGAGHVIGAVDAELPSDGQAHQFAEQRRNGRPAELWAGARRVRVYDAGAAEPAS